MITDRLIDFIMGTMDHVLWENTTNLITEQNFKNCKYIWFFFSRNIPAIIASFLWLGLPMVSYWFIYCERISEESLHILHIIVVFDIFATFISYLTLIWIWIFCSTDGGCTNLGVPAEIQDILKEQAPPSLFCSPKPSDLEEKVFYEMKDFNGNFSQKRMQNCNFCTKAPRYAKKRQNNLCTQS